MREREALGNRSKRKGKQETERKGEERNEREWSKGGQGQERVGK